MVLQAPLSVEFSRQEYWSGLPVPSPGDLFYPGNQTQVSHIAGTLFTIWATREGLVNIDAAAAAAKSLQSFPTLCNPIVGSPPGSPVPGDSPGKNTGVGCHCLLQCMSVKSESEVAQLCPTLHNPMDCSPPGSLGEHSSNKSLKVLFPWATGTVFLQLQSFM